MPYMLERNSWIVNSENECRAQMETNFFAPANIIRHVLPAMRKRKSGIIVNISSAAGIEARATRSMYSGSKFALEGTDNLPKQVR